MKRLISGFLFVLLLCALAPSAGAGPDGLNWRSWDAGLREASSAKKPVLVDVYTNWCGWCKRMERDVYSRSEVRDYLSRRFVIVKLNAESAGAAGYEGQSYTERTLASRFRVNGYPTTIFLAANGEHLVNVPGYVTADRFLPLLRYIGEGYYERGVSFEDFTKNDADHAHHK
jgi:thioredoxin-related protein